MPYMRYPENREDITDFRTMAKKYVLPGLIPEGPFLSRKDHVSTAGSCFARNICYAMRAAGIDTTHLHYTDKLATPPITNTLIRRALIGTDYPEFGESLRLNKLSVITHGLGITPHVDGKPLTEPYVKHKKSAKYLPLFPDQVAECTLDMISQIRAVNPFSVIVLTVSPLPIQSSFFKESVVAVDCVSKSSLRVGVEMVMHKGLENVFYWPSFEIVKWLSPHLSPVFGAGDAEHYRTISSDLVQLITDLFIESYFVPED